MNIIDKFLNEYSDAGTIKTYKTHLNHFFRYINIEPDKYFQNGRDYLQDLKDYNKSQSQYAPMGRLARLNLIKLFLEENGHPINKKDWKKILSKVKGRRARTIDQPPTKEELRKILAYGDRYMRTLILLGTSAGMRIGEMLQLLPSDIDINATPVKVTIRGEITKTGEPRITFASEEFKKEYQEWINERETYLKISVARCKGSAPYKDVNDPRVFPLNHATTCKKYYRMLKKAQLDQRDASTGYYKRHVHTWRKFFETQMSNAGVPEAIYQELEGHTGYLNGAYKRYTEKEIIEWYHRGLPKLLIYTGEVTEVKEQLKEKDRTGKFRILINN